MAIETIAKQMGNNGSTPGNRVVLHIYDASHTLSDTDFTFTNDNGSVTLTARKIETVMNMGPSAVTINGMTFETGRWECSLVGGINVAGNSITVVFDNVATGNVIIEFRS